MNDLIFEIVPETPSTPNPYQPASLEYRHAVGLLTGLVLGIREAYEGQPNNEKLIAHLDTVLERVEEVLGDGE